MMKKIIISVALCINYTNSEFILYRVDSKKSDIVETIKYKSLSKEKKTDLSNLVQQTVFRYQWPMILYCYESLTEQEKKEYVEVLKKPRGLFNFIKNKVEELSNKKYSIAWVPTTVFELKALNCFMSPIGAYTENSIKTTVENIFEEPQEYFKDELIKWYCNICDDIYTNYRIDTKFIFEITDKNFKEIINIIKNFGNVVRNNENAANFGYIGIRNMGKYNMYDMYNDEMLPIIQKYLLYEQQAFEKNMFILSRGTNGYDRSKNFYFDYELGPSKIKLLSYGYSLFAGTVFERYYLKYDDPMGARSIDYMLHNKIGYLLLCNISDVFNGQKMQNIFNFPIFNTIQSLFERGETFHPRLNSNITKLSSLEKSKIAQQLAGYLSQAQLIKLDKDITASNEILDQDKQMQLMIVSHEEAQGRFSIEKEEEMERFETIVLPMLKSGTLPLKNVPDDMLQYVNKPIFDQLKDSQLQNVTLPQIEKLPKDLEEEAVFRKIYSPLLISGNLPLKDLPTKMWKFIDVPICTQMSNDRLKGLELIKDQMNRFSNDVQSCLIDKGVVVLR